MILVANTECLGCNEPNQLTGVEVECALEADRLPIFFFFDRCSQNSKLKS